MEENVELVKIVNNEISQKLRYRFQQTVSGDNWKLKYQTMCKIKGIVALDQGNLSDYEYFTKTHPIMPQNGNVSQYYLVDNGEPVTYITLTKDAQDLVDITYTTPSKYAGKGYATRSVEMLEELLFSNKNIRGIKLLDQFSTGGATTKIATKRGFEQQDNGLLFIKYNPNYQERDYER